MASIHTRLCTYTCTWMEKAKAPVPKSSQGDYFVCPLATQVSYGVVGGALSWAASWLGVAGSGLAAHTAFSWCSGGCMRRGCRPELPKLGPCPPVPWESEESGDCIAQAGTLHLYRGFCSETQIWEVKICPKLCLPISCL